MPMAHEPLTEADKKALLDLARTTIEHQLRTGTSPTVDLAGERLAAACGAFVSLHKRGALRGCIGSFVGRGPLTATVQEMAISASLHDPRFPSLTTDELAEVDLEISVLSPLRAIEHVDEIQVGLHGIFITRDFHSGVLLPQVATDQGWDRQTFLEHTCMKAGLPKDAWREAETRIEIFDAQVFGEQDFAD
jgi:AmmeMemoRadiSam system protein A